jgi:copper chaperone CopZ
MKRFFLPVVLFAAAALLAGGCRVRDVRTVELRVPGVADEASLAKARAALRTLPDSRLANETGNAEKCLRVDADFASGTLTVRYDSMKVGTKNLVDALSKAGFEAEEVRGDGAR